MAQSSTRGLIAGPLLALCALGAAAQTIPNLPAVNTPAASDLFAVSQIGSSSRKESVTQLSSVVAPLVVPTRNLTAYGAVCDGVTDDTTAIRAALTALGGTATTLVWPNGHCFISGALTVTAPIQFAGQSIYNSGLTWTNTTLQALSVTGAAPIEIKDFSFNGPITASAGWSLKMSTSSGANAFSVLRDVEFIGGWDQFLTTTGVSDWIVDGDIFNAYQDIGVTVEDTATPDGGDSTIVNSTFTNGASGSTGIEWKSGGGLRVHNNKLIGGAYGFQVIEDSAVATSDLFISGNSIENQTVSGLKFRSAGGGSTLSNVLVNYNQFNSMPIFLDMSGAAFLGRVNITGNVGALAASASAGLNFANVSGIFVATNNITNVSGTGVGVISGSNNSGVIGPNELIGFNAGNNVTNASGSITVLPVNIFSFTIAATTSSTYGSALFSTSSSYSFSPVFSIAPTVNCSANGVSGGVSVIVSSTAVSGFSYTVVGATNGGSGNILCTAVGTY